MPDTYLIDEVRAVRHRIAEECGNDIMKIIEHAAASAAELGFSVKRTADIRNG